MLLKVITSALIISSSFAATRNVVNANSINARVPLANARFVLIKRQDDESGTQDSKQDLAQDPASQDQFDPNADTTDPNADPNLDPNAPLDDGSAQADGSDSAQITFW